MERSDRMKKRKRKRIARTIILLVLLAVVLAGGYFVWRTMGGSAESETVYVQPVSEIMGLGYVGGDSRYTGVVQARDVVNVDPDSGLKVKECFVKAGDTVKAGDPLFSYDLSEITVSVEQLKIDITGLENTISANEDKIASLEKQIAKAKKASVLYELKMDKSTAELEKKKAEFDLADKQEELATMEKAMENAMVYSPCTGKIKSVKKTDDSGNDPYSYYGSSSESSAYISIISGDDFCVKGTVSEQTIRTLSAGMPVTVRSRVDENKTYPGTIYKVNTEETESSQNNFYYDSGSEKASKYAFYVELNGLDDLILGQHVYIELGTAEGTVSAGVKLPSYFIAGLDAGSPYVYAKGTDGKLEKRAVTLGAYDEAEDSYEILSGLTLNDYIAFPDDTLTPGATCTEALYTSDTMDTSGDGVYEGGAFIGTEDDGLSTADDGIVELS